MLSILRFRKQLKMRRLLSHVPLHAIIHLLDDFFFSCLKAGMFINSTTFPKCPICSNTRQLAKGIHGQRASEKHICILK